MQDAATLSVGFYDYLTACKKQLFGAGDELGGSVLEQEGTVAETPEDADAGEAGIAGGEDVDIAVADVDGGAALGSQAAEGLVDGVGGGLAADSFGLVLADGYGDFGEEVGHELLGGCHHFVADDGHGAASAPEFVQGFGYSGVGARGVEGVVHVVLAEGGEHFLKLGWGQSWGNGPLHQSAHAVAYEAADVVGRVLRESELAQGVVCRCREVAEGVEQGAVEVEDIGCIFAHGRQRYEKKVRVS